MHDDEDDTQNDAAYDSSRYKLYLLFGLKSSIVPDALSTMWTEHRFIANVLPTEWTQRIED
jgi:hypothetical protein